MCSKKGLKMKTYLALALALLMFLSACGAPTLPSEPVISEIPSASEMPEKTETSEVIESPEKTEKKERPAIPEVPECSLEHLADFTPAARGEVKNILMIGNSFCFYFVEELYGVAAAAGFDPTIVNVYEAGCTMQEHWKYLLSLPVSFYQIYRTDSTGRVKISESAKLSETLESAQWDVISLQQHFTPTLAYYPHSALESCEPYVTEILAHLRDQQPQAELFWHQTWAYQSNYKGMNQEKQQRQHDNIRIASRKLCEDHKIGIIPSGDAWALARANTAVGDVLCKDDAYHDGDIGGGQYLNACVWFEVLFGKSCVGNTWRPNYALSEERISALQQAAHEAVASVYGAEYAK